jgi:P27 family predicted phage terminase small subunit
MSVRGPAPTPTEVLKARGSWRAKARAGEPADEVAAPRPPDWLDAEAVAEWKRLVPLLKQRRTVYRSCRGALAVMCDAWSLFCRAVRQRDALLAGAVPDALAVRRWAAIAAEAQATYLKVAQEFGLTPASRARVQAAQPPVRRVESRDRGASSTTRPPDPPG